MRWYQLAFVSQLELRATLDHGSHGEVCLWL